MFPNPDKFKAILISKNTTSDEVKKITITGNIEIENVSSVKLLGITIDNALNFNEHIDKICKSAANQLNVLVRLRSYLGNEERKILVNTFVVSNFNYCALIWFTSSIASLKKVENLHKRALRIL